MSRRSNRGYIDSLAIILIAIILILFSFLAITHSPIFVSYSRDVINNETYCSSQDTAPEHHEDTDCQSFWYRTLNDPAISWNFYYSCLTGILVILAGGTIAVALHSVSIQRRDAQRLFIADQRPWIKAEITFGDEPFQPLKNKSVMLNFAVTLTNVGKGPAFDVGNPGIQAYRHETDASGAIEILERFPARKSWNLKFIRERDRLREAVRANKLFVPSTTIHAGDSIFHAQKWAYYIPEADANATWETKPQSCIYIYLSVPYKSSLEENKWYETTIVCAVNNGMLVGFQIPRNDEDLQSFAQIRAMTAKMEEARIYIRPPHLDRIDGLCVTS